MNATDDMFGYTVLMWAAWYNSPEVAKLLLDAGADVDAKDNFGWTALMLTAWEDSADVTELLIAAGADANAKDNDGETALMMAVRHGHCGTAHSRRSAVADNKQQGEKKMKTKKHFIAILMLALTAFAAHADEKRDALIEGGAANPGESGE